MKNVRIDIDAAIAIIEKDTGKRPTHKDVAEMIGVSSLKTIRNMHVGSVPKILSQMKELAKITNMSLDDLIIYENGK